jgi:uncharacterized protein (DUF362 family)
MQVTKVAIAHSNDGLGKPGEYSREQYARVRALVKEVVDGSMGGMQNVVRQGQTVLIKINTVIPSPPNAGFTTDPRLLEALIDLVAGENPARIQIGERSAMGGDTLGAMDACGVTAVAKRMGAELLPFDNVPFDMVKLDNMPIFAEFPIPRPVREADVYIGLPKMKTHLHTVLTCAQKLQFGNLPNYDWMTRCHRDDIHQKIVNLTRAAKPKWFLVDSLYACQGSGPFSPYAEDLIADFNTILGGPDPVAVDTVVEALMDWDEPGTNVPYTRLAAQQGLGTNRLEEIELVGAPIASVKRRFRKADANIVGVFQNVQVVMGAACVPGCQALVRLALDAVNADGTLAKLKRPLTIFVGKQFEPLARDVAGDVIVYGDCAQNMCDIYPYAAYWGSCEEFPNCAAIWSNIPDRGLVKHIHTLVEA